jgi:hypothetical protein
MELPLLSHGRAIRKQISISNKDIYSSEGHTIQFVVVYCMKGEHQVRLRVRRESTMLGAVSLALETAMKIRMMTWKIKGGDHDKLGMR